MKRLVLGPLCLGLLGLIGSACSAGGGASGTTTTGGSTGTGGTPGVSGSSTTGGSAVSNGGAPASSGGSTTTSGGASSGGANSGGANSGGATVTTKGGATGTGGTMGSSGPPPPIGGFAVTITPGQFGMKDPTCGVQAFKRERKPTEVIMVLDRSASMKDETDAGPRRWDVVVPAVTGAITSTNAALSWGLKLYPEGEDTDSCSAETIVPLIHVPVAANNAMNVVNAINRTTPEGDGTPTGDAIKFATDHLRARGNDNQKFILLATDGDPSCPSGNQAIEYAVTNIAAALTAGFPTFVVGVDMASSVDRLNRMAVAGGRPRPITATNPAAFYVASTQAELTTALQTITGQVASCVFELNPPPPVPDNIAVDFNGQRAARDPSRMNGWEYTSPAHTSLEVFGPFCDMIKKETMNQVDIKYGCPGVPIPLPG